MGRKHNKTCRKTKKEKKRVRLAKIGKNTSKWARIHLVQKKNFKKNKASKTRKKKKQKRSTPRRGRTHTKTMKGGARSDWVEWGHKTANSTSYKKSGYGGHCTIWKGGDIHCKAGGNKKCGKFYGTSICNHNPSKGAYNDFCDGATDCDPKSF